MNFIGTNCIRRVKWYNFVTFIEQNIVKNNIVNMKT
jgi:hypothetical protein